jgi:hypothetical protein
MNEKERAQTTSLTEDDAKLIKAIHGKVKAIEQALTGYDGTGGLCQEVRSNTQSISKIWIVLGFIVGALGISGIGVGIAGFLG